MPIYHARVMRKQHAAAAALFLALSVVMTWPLVRNLGSAISYPGDPYINAWILDWDWWATLHQPLSLFQANTLYPARYTLAFSENLYGIALVLMPFRIAGVAPITAYNIAMLLGFAFSGFAAYLLGFHMTRSFAGGVAAGIFHAFVPFRFTQMPHLQHVWGGWVPMLLLTLVWYAERPSWRRGVVFGVVFLMNGLTNIHWLLFGSFAVAAAWGLFMLAGIRHWRELIVSTAAATILLIPFLYPYAALSREFGIGRDWGETQFYSARLSDWLVCTVMNPLYSALYDIHVDAERWLFPGAIAIVCALASLFLIRRYTRSVILGLLWTILGVMGSLGLNSWFHTFLFDAVPGFRAIRVPARWAEIAYAGMALLIAVTVAAIPRRARFVAWIVPLLLVLELRPVLPIRWYQAIPATPEVYTWLANQPTHGATLELPIDVAGSEYLYVFRSTAHHKSIVNGVSGAATALARLTPMWRQSPIGGDLITELRGIGGELLIVHADTVDNPDTRPWLQRELDRGRIRFMRRFNGGVLGDWVFSLGRGPVSRPAELEAFLRGERTYNPATFGAFDPPASRFTGAAHFTGYAFSPFGIRSVDVLFENGGVRIPATLTANEQLTRMYPWYPQTRTPRFAAWFLSRPAGVREETDVQVEITDGDGRKIHLPHYWIIWRDK